ncbi:hypothetical protein IPM09_02910 [Candidatus Saccharibacteria bacterium]|nr:MAG: hypothetical protein IPM09_02910 [Candidatus Saccharibacteria bacterium]
MNLKRIAATAAVVVGLGMAAACSSPPAITPTSASCGFVVGSGTNGADQAVQGVVYPGQKLSIDTRIQVVKYVPCNQRNYLVTDGTRKNANDQVIGDTFTGIEAFTKDGTKVLVYVGMYWTPNQDRDVMLKSFFPLCDKYQCFSSASQDGRGDVNSSSKGWNAMLGENVPFAIGSVLRTSLKEMDDSVWKTGANWSTINASLADGFQPAFRKMIGASSDVMCGNGETSYWTGTPGQGSYTCGKVRFEVTNVINADPNQQKLANEENAQKLAEAANAARKRAALAAYGTQADYWLGVQDSIQKCHDAGVNCTVVVGNGVSVNPAAK